MILQTPTTKQISDNIIAQIESYLGQTVPLLPKAFTRVLAKALSGVFILVYKYAGFIFLQMFIRTATMADTEINGKTISPLKEWGRAIGVGDPLGANHAELVIQLRKSGEVPDTHIPAGTQLISSTTGRVYLTTEAVLIDEFWPGIPVTIRAVDPGADSNLLVGDLVYFATPFPLLWDNETAVTAVKTTAADAESEEAYRQRILDRSQRRLQGGALADYAAWATEVSGIIKAYPYNGAVPGEIDLYIEASPESSGSPNGYPTAAQAEAVRSHIYARCPANVVLNIQPITRVTIRVDVADLVTPDEAAVKQSIIDAVIVYEKSIEPFILGLSVLPRNDSVHVSAISGIIHKIVSSAGGTVGVITLYRAGAAVTSYQVGTGQKIIPDGNVTWS